MSLHIFDDLEQEEWRTTPGFEGYEVSNFGRVRSYRAHGGNRGGRLIETPRTKTTRRHSTGYLFVVLQSEPGKSRPTAVHTLVAAAFLGPRPDGYQVAHADGNKLNARLENLRYATASENAQDKVAHGTAPVGERNARAKLTNAHVVEIKRCWAAGETQVSLARRFRVSRAAIQWVLNGRNWAHLEEAS